jgi:hypothetical protein
MESVYLFAALFAGAVAGCVGVAIGHYFHEYVRAKGWRGWHIDG